MMFGDPLNRFMNTVEVAIASVLGAIGGTLVLSVLASVLLPPKEERH